jgi:two-component system NtrC family response regulator
MERVLASARLEPTLFTKHLPTNIRVEVTRAAVEHDPASFGITLSNDSIQTLPKLNDYREAVYNDAEKNYLFDLLTLADQNIREACRISGLSQSRLYALIKKHDITRGR